MEGFLGWFEQVRSIDPVLKAGLAHLYFVTIHPFEDGNGRMARAITDMQLARAEGTPKRFYSMSSQIEKDKKAYYHTLERTQKGEMDVTRWLEWFLTCLQQAIDASSVLLSDILSKANFWRKHGTTSLNERQKEMLNKLFDNFVGVLNTTKWAKMTKVSQDTADRDIKDLVKKGILRKDEGSGKNTNYLLVP
jgi:Fic family protein